MTRHPFRAGSFYPHSGAECEKLIDQFVKEWQNKNLPAGIKAGIVPHAGWAFSGPTAAGVYAAFQNSEPRAFIIFGAVHAPGIASASLFPEGSWQSPLGDAIIDAEINKVLIEGLGDLVVEDASAHKREHSIEVQIPFIQRLFPKAKIVAIMVPPNESAHILGQRVGKLLKENALDAAVLGSTDLTHYGAMNFGFAPAGSGENALKWVKDENDRAIINKILAMEDEAIVSEAYRNNNACGAGAIAATLGAAKSMGITNGTLLQYTTSQDVMPDRPISDFVGYASIVF